MSSSRWDSSAKASRFRRCRSRRLTILMVLISTVATLQALPLLRPPATLAATPTGGEFVATQGRIMDTRPSYGVGGFTTPMTANAWRSVQVAGNAGVPSSGVGAVQLSVTALMDGASAGTVFLSKYLSTPQPQSVLQYGTIGGVETNTAVVAMVSSGKIMVEATSGTDLLLDVQGYYTAGDPTAGGFVPVAPTRVVDTRYGVGLSQAKLLSGSAPTIQVTGQAAVPSDATAIFANITIQNYTGHSGYATPYPSDQSRPTSSLNFPDQATTAFGTTVSLSDSGAVKLWISSVLSPGVDVWIDVEGYFTASVGGGGFTPLAASVATNVGIPAGTTTRIAVAGVAGVPAVGSGIGSVAMNVRVWTGGTDGGWLRLWDSTAPEPGTSSINLAHAAGTISNFVTTELGTDGKIAVYNAGPSNVNMTINVQGWYGQVSPRPVAIDAMCAVPNADGCDSPETVQSARPTLQAKTTDPYNTTAHLNYTF